MSSYWEILILLHPCWFLWNKHSIVYQYCSRSDLFRDFPPLIVRLLVFLQLWRAAVGAADGRGAVQRDRWARCRLRSRRQQAHAAHPLHVPRTLRSAHGRWGQAEAELYCAHAAAQLRRKVRWRDSAIAWDGIGVPALTLYFHFPKAGLGLRKQIPVCCQ